MLEQTLDSILDELREIRRLMAAQVGENDPKRVLDERKRKAQGK